MRVVRLPLLLCSALILSCGREPVDGITVNPDAELELTVQADPPEGPFNGEITVTFTSIKPATIYVSTNGEDPRETSNGRVQGVSPFTITINQTTTLRYFASARGTDGPLQEGTWVRAGGPRGTITGVVVIGGFAAGKAAGLFNNGEQTDLGVPTGPMEVPFSYTGLASGTYQLLARSDRNGDGLLWPVIDFSSATTTVTLDLNDPYTASAENVRIYLAASEAGLGTLRGTITLPKPPLLQDLRVSVLDPGALTGGLDPTSLLTQLQNGYAILTTPTQTEYPYVITGLQPGTVIPAASLIGFANGGLAVNLLANPLQPAQIVAGQETIANFVFGPVTLTGAVTLGPQSAPTGGLNFGVVAGRSFAFGDASQIVLMPVLFTEQNGSAVASYAGTSLRSNANFGLKVFTGTAGLTEAFTWVLTPIGGAPADANVQTGTTDVTRDITLP